MALAILDLLDYDDAAFQFQIDTGTNSYYEVKAGTSVRRDLGIDLVGGVYWVSSMARNPAGGDPFHSSAEVQVPRSGLDRAGTFVQLFSYLTPDRRCPAVSQAVRIPGGARRPAQAPSDYAASFEHSCSMGASTMTPTANHAMRRIAHRTPGLSRQASFDQILGQVLRLAAPVVMDLLKGGTPGGGATPGGAAGASAPAGVLAQILQTLLGQGGVPALSVPHSRNLRATGDNRFARPFVFGIDDALIGAAIGQLVQVLPQIMNSANQRRIEMKKADNQLMAGLASDVNRRLMLDKLAELQRQPPAAGSLPPEQIQQLIALLQQEPAGAAPAAAPASGAPAVATPASLRSYSLSNRSMLAFELGPDQEWGGRRYPLFARQRSVLLRVRFTVGDPAPKSPLHKALLKIVWKDADDPAAHFEKTFRHKDVAAGAVLKCPFTAGELAHLPAGRPLTVVAELRWRAGREEREIRALGSFEAVLIQDYFLQDSGKESGDERELRDLNAYRSFWNKLWESPSLGAQSGPKQYHWELDADCRYSVVLSADHDSNGMMEPRLKAAAGDPESLTRRIEGRMKAGIELSLTELNKLQPLWNMEPIDAARLHAFSAGGFLNGRNSEFIHHLRLKGRAGQRGLVWVAPVFKMFGFRLGKVSEVDQATGQVTGVGGEDTHLPLPVAARVIGLKSKD